MKEYTNSKRLIILRALLLLSFVNLFSIQNTFAQYLRDYAKVLNLNFGSPTQGLKQQMQDTLSQNFNFTIPGNALKFSNVEPKQGKFDFRYADSVVDFAEKHGMKVKGHCLIWHWSEPGWLWYYSVHGHPTREGMLKIMKTHIDSVVGHFKGRINEWDLVNEAILDKPDAQGSCLKNTHWRSIIGPDYIDSAFVYAHRADPKAYLYLNDYSGEMNFPQEKVKADLIYEFIKGLVKRGIPIHGVGLESHINNIADEFGIYLNIKRYAELGIRVAMTETDIMHSSFSPTAWSAMLNAAVANYNFTTFVVWGMTDLYSWKGRDCDCLMWDVNFRRKPSIFKVVTKALENADKKVAILRGRFQAIPADDRIPDTPDSLTASTEGKHIVLRWGATKKALTYAVERATTLEGPFQIIDKEILDTFYVDKHVKKGTAYYYKILADNPFSISRDSKFFI